MDARRILASYDEQMRRDCPVGTAEVAERRARVTRVWSDGPGPRHACVLFSSLDDDTADDAIREEVAFARARGVSLEWKLYEHDRPSDLGRRLSAHGFRAGEREALLALDLSTERILDAPAAAADIRRVEDDQALEDLLAVQLAIWGEEVSDLRDALRRELRETPTGIAAYVAHVGSQPVCAAWIRFHPGRDFADLWGGSTLPAHRGQGIYRALVARRAADARERGVRFLTVDALPASRPILERLGFAFLTSTIPCTLDGA